MRTSQTRFTVVYGGDALSTNRMDVRDLAPALLALGDLLEQTNRSVNGDRATVTVSVKAFKAGSFGIDFELVQSGMNYVKELFSPESSVRDTVELLALLGINAVEVGKGLFWLIRKMKGRKPKGVKKLKDGNISLELEADDGSIELVETTQEIVDLYQNEKVRSALDKSMEPLRKEGIDSFCVEGENGERNVLATSADADYFALPQTSPVAIDLTEDKPQERILSIVSLSFKEDNKWRLSDGTAIFNVKISDGTFLKKVNEGASFSKGDMLRINLVTRVSYTREGLKTEYEAVKVLEHITIPRQLWLS